MITDPDDAFDTATYVLSTINSVYQEFSGVTSPLPSRQFVAVGGTGSQPHDCEQVTVSLDQIYVGLPGAPAQEPATCHTPRSGVFVVEVVRRTVIQQKTVRGGTVPEIKTPEQQTALAKIQMQDHLCLLEAGMRVADAGIGGGVADVSAGPEMGGYQAIVLSLIVVVG